MSKENHSFSIDLACKVGINAAIILQHLAHLHKICLGNGANWKHGRYWLNKSIRAFSIIYPYLTNKEIRGALDKLEQTGYILSAKIADNHFDRTKWYSLEPEGFDLLGIAEDLRQIEPGAFAKRANGDTEKGKSDLSKRANENLPKGQMNIKVNYSNYNYSNGASETPPNGELPTDAGALPNLGYTFEVFWNDYAHKVGSKAKAEKAFAKLTEADRGAIRDTIEMYKRDTVTTDKGRAGGNFKALRQHPLTYLNGRVWETYQDRKAQTDQPTEFDEAYQVYIDWVERNYAHARRTCANFSKAQFIEFKRTSKADIIGKESENKFLKAAHENAGEKDAWTIYQKLLNDRLEARRV